jgi:hypothetical protein
MESLSLRCESTPAISNFLRCTQSEPPGVPPERREEPVPNEVPGPIDEPHPFPEVEDVPPVRPTDDGAVRRSHVQLVDR